jgi:hypothetical protein
MRAHEITEGFLDKAKSFAHNAATNWSDTYANYQGLKSTAAQRAAIQPSTAAGPASGEALGILPRSGNVLVVTTANQGRYFKDIKGQWYNELFQPLPYSQFASLELLLQQGKGQERTDPRGPIGGATSGARKVSRQRVPRGPTMRTR